MLGVLMISVASAMPIHAWASDMEFKLVVDCTPALAHYPPLFSDKKTICVGSEAIMTGANIIFAKAAHNRYSDGLVDITFDKDAQTRMAEITRDHVGGQIAVLSDGKLLTAAIIEEPILGDTIELNLASSNDRDAILKQFQDRKVVK